MTEDRELLAVLCQSLHTEGCMEMIPEGFQFCPACGLRAVCLTFPDFSTSLSTISLVLQPNQTTHKVRLANSGPGSVSVEITGSKGLMPIVRKLAIPGVMRGRPGQKVLELKIETDHISSGRARLELTAGGVTPVADDPWADRIAKTHNVQIEWHQRHPAQLVVLTPTLMFHPRDGTSRLLRIINSGDTALPIILPSLPAGFVFGQRDTLPAELFPGQELSLSIHCCVTSLEAGVETVYFDAPGDNVAFCLVTEGEQAGGIRPDWIIALDFGTSNTSIVARSIPNNSLPIDAGQCFPLLGPGEKTRFPSAMRYDVRERLWAFGDEAREETGSSYNFLKIDDGNSLKMKLGCAGEPYLDLVKDYPSARGEFTIDSLLQTYLRHLRDTIIQPFLNAQPDACVQYVVSLPVLDGTSGEAFQRQRERMLMSFSRIFDMLPSQIITELEPNCAANHLLIGKGYQFLRDKLGLLDSLFSPGDRFIVVDSGGGTTDIAYGEFQEARLGGGRLQFRILRNLGLNEKQDTFGGREVTKFFHRVLNHKPYSQFHHSPCDFPPEKFEVVADFGIACNRIIDDIEKSIKPAYAAEQTPAGLPPELRGELHEFISSNMKSLLDVFRLAISTDPGRKAPRWVFLVGGNTLIHSLESFCLKRLAGDSSAVMPALPAEERFLAVAMGAAYADGLFAPDLAPHTISLILSDRNGALLAEQPLQARSKPLTEFKKIYKLTDAVTVLVKADGMELVRQTIGGPGLTTQLRAAVSVGRLLIDATISESSAAHINSGPPAMLYDGKL